MRQLTKYARQTCRINSIAIAQQQFTALPRQMERMAFAVVIDELPCASDGAHGLPIENILRPFVVQNATSRLHRHAADVVRRKRHCRVDGHRGDGAHCDQHHLVALDRVIVRMMQQHNESGRKERAGSTVCDLRVAGADDR